MKLLSLSRNGIKNAKVFSWELRSGKKYYGILHGEEGRGRWLCKFPFSFKDFPYNEEVKSFEADKDYYSLVTLKDKETKEPRYDRKGNLMFFIKKGKSDPNSSVVFWTLSPGYRGWAEYNIEGKAEVIAEGTEAQGDVGRMGSAPCPVVKVYGPCTLTWIRHGRLYGEPDKYIAKFNGKDWLVCPYDDYFIETMEEDF